jgi:hypothetical protein
MNPPREADHGTRSDGSRADAITPNGWYLIKSVSLLRLTRQIRLLSIGASEAGTSLVLLVRPGCRLSRDLERFIQDHPVVRVERWLGTK